MGYITQPSYTKRVDESKKAQILFAENVKHTKQLLSALPSNRELLNKIKLYGLPKI
jgi:tryptophan halogenase